MENNQKLSFIINFNSYNPHAYVIQNGYFLKFFPKQLNIKNSMIIIDKETNNEFKININLKDLRKKVIETNTNINNEIKINYFKEKNINNQLDVIYQTINF